MFSPFLKIIKRNRATLANIKRFSEYLRRSVHLEATYMGEENKVEEKKEDEPLVLKVEMHCEACAKKVARSLKRFQGVEEVMVDCKGSRVVVKGKTVDPIKVCERIQKKSGRKVEIISPLPKLPEDQQTKQEPPPKQDKKDEPPPVITLVLNIGMHCEACAQVLQKRIRKIKGVESVSTDLAKDQVTVKGVLDPEKIVNDVYKKTKKQATVVKDEEKKEEDKKEESKDEKTEVEEAKEDEDKKGMEIKKSEYYGPKYYTEYSYAPEMFSDENPNACSVM